MTEPQPVRLSDYRPPAWGIERVHISFDLEPHATRVTSTIEIQRRPDAPAGAPLVLDGEDLRLLSVEIEGEPVPADRYALEPQRLTIAGLPDRARLTIVTEIDPAANTRLEGLYLSRGVFCTQCEAEGFRRITYFPDRPDVMARYRVTIRADRTRYPVLLSNGNPVTTTLLADGRHEAVWDDPYPKPSYLFALVAGDLAALADRFVTRSGRAVELRIWAEPGQQERCRYAMDALKRAMRWDEETFGLEYDLDRFNIVAVSDFNMGAMENKSLNIFNSKYIFADPDTATDADYGFVESIVAHEYFHNWTGNRITCRDWFQLSLKEGLTVFRDQQFTAAMRSAAVKRIRDVRALRARQFPEDAGPLAHPVRPDSYIEINNFYTATVYDKGAEVLRMLHTMLGEDGFRRGMDLYVRRHDGQAVTCDDFVAAMADANGVDLTQFKRWYAQAGTPTLSASGRYDRAKRSYALTLAQETPPTPGQPRKEPFHMPVAVGLVGPDGADLAARRAGAGGPVRTTHVLDLTEPKRTFVFEGVEAPPVPSVNRGFSAPVRLDVAIGDAERAFLIGVDSDPFNRWEAAQQYATRLLLAMVGDVQAGREPGHDPAFTAALGRALDDADRDHAFAAQMLALPSEDYIADAMDVVDIEAIHAAHLALRRAVAAALHERLRVLYRRLASNAPYTPDAASAGRRALRNAALALLAELREGEILDTVAQQFAAADNMTDRLAALAILNDIDTPARGAALDAFYRRHQNDPVTVDKWFALQATSTLPGTLEAVRQLSTHPAFSMRNPNKVRALVGAFSTANPLRFHAADGGGYAFLADKVIELERINPTVAARIMTPLGRWRRFDEGRQAHMRQALERILAVPDLSRDVYEIAAKSLA